MKIKVCLPDREPDVRVYEEPVEIRTICEEVQKDYPYRLVLARFDRHVRHMSELLTRSGTLELFDIRDGSARMSYQSGLLLLFAASVHDVAGKDVQVRINNSLSKGLYIHIKGTEVNDTFVGNVEARMKELVKEQVPITKRTVFREDIYEWMQEENKGESIKRAFQATPDLKVVKIFTLQDESWPFMAEVVPDTGFINLFEVREYRHGVLVRFPHPSKPGEILPFEEQKVLYDAFSEQRRWCKITHVHNAADLNRIIMDGNERDLIFMNEALHEKRIAEIAEMIAEQHKRVILIAGPSSSGKTTFANRLCIQLQVAGLDPLYIGTDNYYRGRDLMPIGEDGKPDFEGIEALDLEQMEHDINALLQGEKVDLPVYNFEAGAREYGSRIVTISQDTPIVIEGLHGLNPELSRSFPEADKFRIYISPLAQINADAMNRIPTTDARMLRRIVRDARFRAYSAAQTIEIWPRVNRGEDKNIFPYNIYADAVFNSQCIYELAVLKKYAKPLLEVITDDQPEYPEAQRLLQLLDYFVVMNHDELIPNNSILREFIGGSVIV